MSRWNFAVLTIATFCGLLSPVLADDLVQPGTRWVGSIKVATPEEGKKVKLTSSEAGLVIKTRTGKEFTAEFGWDRTRKVAVEGTIDDKGGVKFRVTKRLTEETVGADLVDNARVQGSFKGEQFIGRFIVPGNDARGGEIKLKLQPPDKKN